MSIHTKLYVPVDSTAQAFTKTLRTRFYHMQFSCQRNSDLIKLLQHHALNREDEAAMQVMVRLIFARN